jgi:hypothetical protein
MAMQRRQHSTQGNAVMVLEGVKERRTGNELVTDYGSIRQRSASRSVCRWRGCANRYLAVVRSRLAIRILNCCST